MTSLRSVTWWLLLLCALLVPPGALADEEPEEAPPKPAYVPKALAPSWRDRAEAAYREKDWAEAVFLYRRWLEADPRDDTTWYNLACCYALAGARDKALDAFETAVDAGWTDASWPREDPDLESLREEARFLAALDRAAESEARDAPASFVRHHVTIRTIGTYVALLPPDYETSEARYPLVVILHGHGSSELRHGRLGDAIGREGVVYVVPRAPYPHPQVFTNLRQPGWTWQPMDAEVGALEPFEPTRLYIDSVLAAVDDARARYRIRGERFYVLGHSMGAFSAHATAILHPERVAAYFAYAGGLAERYHEEKWLAPLAEHGVKAHVVHGKADGVVEPALSEEAHRRLAEAGVDVTLERVDGVGHGFEEPIRDLARAWMERVVRPAPAAAAAGD